MFPITNDIYQLVSGIGFLQNWSSLEITVMTHYWISQCFQSEENAMDDMINIDLLHLLYVYITHNIYFSNRTFFWLPVFECLPEEAW